MSHVLFGSLVWVLWIMMLCVMILWVIRFGHGYLLHEELVVSDKRLWVWEPVTRVTGEIWYDECLKVYGTLWELNKHYRIGTQTIGNSRPNSHVSRHICTVSSNSTLGRGGQIHYVVIYNIQHIYPKSTHKNIYKDYIIQIYRVSHFNDQNLSWNSDWDIDDKDISFLADLAFFLWYQICYNPIAGLYAMFKPVGTL